MSSGAGALAPAAATREGEWLEDGWSPSTPLADSVLRRAVHALAASTVRPATALGARVLRTADVVATDVGRPAGYWNGATVLRPLDDTGWATVLGRLDAFLEGAPAGPRQFELWSPFPTPDLGGRGWRREGHPPLMWRPPGPGEGPPGGLSAVERVSDEASLAAWAATAVDAYPLEGAPGTVGAPALLEVPGIALFVMRGPECEGPAGVAGTLLTHGVNVVFLVAVRPHARGRGYGRALTWAATCVAPDRPAVLLASDDGRPLYERLGYASLLRWTLWTRPVG